jgi:hypothetical protein
MRVLLKTFERSTRGHLGTTREDFKTTQRSAGVPSSLRMIRAFLGTFGLWNLRMLMDYSPRPSRLLEDILLDYKVLGACRMDITGPTTQVGTRTDYSGGPGTTQLGLRDTCWRGAQGLQRDITRLGSYTCPDPCKVLLAVHD